MNDPVPLMHNLPVRDALVAPLWLASNAALVWFEWAIVRAARPRAHFCETALAVTVLWLTTVVGLTTLAGVMAVLRPGVLATCVVGLCVFGSWWLRHANGRSQNAGLLPESDLPSSCIEAGRVWCVGENWWLWGWLSLLAVLVGHVVLAGLIQFPTEFDGLAYHIPLIDHWLQAANLYVPDAAWWWTSANAEIVGLWAVAPFSGDFFIALFNLPFIVLWVLAGLEVAGSAGLSVGWRNLAVLAIVAVHTTFHEAEKAMNDIAVAGCFFAALAFGFRYFKSRRRSDLIFAGVALGLLAGIKYFALGYAMLAGGVLLAAAALMWGWREAICTGAFLTVTALPFGGYWYLRNLWFTGAPLYPQGADDAGTGYPHLWQTTFAGNSEPDLLSLSARALWRMTGPCHVAAIVALPLTVIVLFWVGTNWLRRRERAEGVILLSLCAIVVGAAAIFVCTPFAVENQPRTLNHLRWAYTPARYGLCFLSLSMLGFAWLLQQCCERFVLVSARLSDTAPLWGRRISLCTQSLFGAAIVWQCYLRIKYLQNHSAFFNNPDLIGAGLIGANIVAFCWLAVELSGRKYRYRRVVGCITVASVLVSASACTAILSDRWHDGYARYFDAMRDTKIFSRLADDRRSLRIAVLDARPYPFFGSARQHKVCGPRVLTTYDELVRYLSVRRPDIVVSRRQRIAKVFDRYKPLPEWLTANESQFPPLLDSGEFSLFSFVDSTSTALWAAEHVAWGEPMLAKAGRLSASHRPSIIARTPSVTGQPMPGSD